MGLHCTLHIVGFWDRFTFYIVGFWDANGVAFFLHFNDLQR